MQTGSGGTSRQVPADRWPCPQTATTSPAASPTAQASLVYTLPSLAPNPALFSFLASHAHLFCQTPNFIIPPLSPQGLQLTSQVLERKVKYRLQSLTKDSTVSEQPNATLYPFLWQPAHPTQQKDTLPHAHTLQDFLVHYDKRYIRGSQSQGCGEGKWGATA